MSKVHTLKVERRCRGKLGVGKVSIKNVPQDLRATAKDVVSALVWSGIALSDMVDAEGKDPW